MNSKAPIFSLELQILVEAIKLILLKARKDRFLELINLQTINWDRLYEMIIYHRIRPLFYEACRVVEFENNIVSRIKNFTKYQIMSNLVIGEELGRILALFQENDIVAIPYKGIFFQEKLYGNKFLRESNDVDILVVNESILKTIKLLILEDYIIISEFSEIDNFDDLFLKDLINRTQKREIGLMKKLISGLTINIDLHWAISENFHQYEIDLSKLFQQSSIKSFQKRLLILPNSETIFKMMLNHHGGRGCWLRLKDFCDLIAYRSQYPEHEFLYLKTLAIEMKMSKVLDVGNSIMQVVFMDSEQYLEFDEKTQHRVFAFWEISKHYDRFWPKLNYYIIYRQLQDTPLSWIKLIHKLAIFYSTPSKLERRRLIVLPDRFIYLSAFSKFISYLWYRLKSKDVKGKV